MEDFINNSGCNLMLSDDVFMITNGDYQDVLMNNAQDISTDLSDEYSSDTLDFHSDGTNDRLNNAKDSGDIEDVVKDIEGEISRELTILQENGAFTDVIQVDSQIDNDMLLLDTTETLDLYDLNFTALGSNDLLADVFSLKKTSSKPAIDNSAKHTRVTENSTNSATSHHTKNDNASSNSCHVCQLTFKDEMELVLHMLTHSEKICSKLFADESFRDHVHHLATEKPYKCSMCNKWTFSVMKHVMACKDVHKAKKVHKCDICHKKFTRSWGLSLHMKVHNGEKPHACDVCDKAFATRSNLMQHRQLHQSKVKCEICHKQFGQKRKLKAHMLKYHS